MLINGKWLYCTKWLGFPYENNTWEPESSFRDADGAVCQALTDWKRKQAAKLIKFAPYKDFF